MVDYMDFLEMTPQEMKDYWLNSIRSRDPLMLDTGDYTFNSVLAEAVAAQFWATVQLIKRKVLDASPTTAEGDALDALVLDRLPGGRYGGARATGDLKFYRIVADSVDHVIPAGMMAAYDPEEGDTVVFETTEEVTLLAGNTFVYASARAVEPGISGNVPYNTITRIVTPVYGIHAVTNELPFSGGTDQESDADLRDRYKNAIWETGRATIPMIEEHIDDLETVREVLVKNLGSGDILIVVDSAGKTNPTADELESIDDVIETNIGAGITAPGLLAATLRNGGNSFELGDSSGGHVWARSRQYLAAEDVVSFTYMDAEGNSKTGTATFPAGSPEGATVNAVLQNSEDLATIITGSSYVGSNEFDIYIGLGSYPRCWVAPELQSVDVSAEVEIADTSEENLIDKIIASVSARIDAYGVGETIHHSDIYRCFFVDYATKRVFNGIRDVNYLNVDVKGTTLTFGQELTPDFDERFEPGDLTGIVGVA